VDLDQHCLNASLKTLTNVHVGKMPHNVQVSPDGKLAWLTNNGEPDQAADVSAHKGMAQGDHDAMGKPGAIWAIDTATNMVVAKVPVGMHPAHVVVSPDGRLAYCQWRRQHVTSGAEPRGDDSMANFPWSSVQPGWQRYRRQSQGWHGICHQHRQPEEVAQVPAGGVRLHARRPFGVPRCRRKRYTTTQQHAGDSRLRTVPISCTPPDSRTPWWPAGYAQDGGKTVSMIDLETSRSPRQS
jgi:hypothetical protein